MCWLTANCPSFDPFLHSHLPSEWAQTALAEVALSGYLHGRKQSLSQDTRKNVNQIADVAGRFYAQKVYWSYPFEIEPLALPGHLSVWLFLKNAKKDMPVQRGDFQTIINNNLDLYIGQDAHKVLELRYFCDRVGLETEIPSVPIVLEGMRLEELLRKEQSSTSEIYKITHIIFYATDFGKSGQDFFSNAYGRSLHDFIVQSSLQQVDCQNWDLYAELLLCLLFLESPNTDLMLDMSKVLASLQDANGCLAHRLDGTIETGNLDSLAVRYHGTLIASLMDVAMSP